MNLTSQLVAFEVVSLSEVDELAFIQAAPNPVVVTYKEDGNVCSETFYQPYLSPGCQTGAKTPGATWWPVLKKRLH